MIWTSCARSPRTAGRSSGDWTTKSHWRTAAPSGHWRPPRRRYRQSDTLFGATKRSASIRDRLIRSSMIRTIRRASSRMVAPKRQPHVGGKIALVGEGFGIAEDRRERRAQLVAGVGDEIDAHLLGRHRGRAVGHPDQHRIAVEPAHVEAPRPAKLADAGHVDIVGSPGEDMLQRLRMPDREAHVAAHDSAAEQLARRDVGEPDDIPLDQKRGLLEGIDQRLNAGGRHNHRPVCSRSARPSHIPAEFHRSTGLTRTARLSLRCRANSRPSGRCG